MSLSVLTNTFITDGDGQTWNNGIWSAVLICPIGPPTVAGVPVSPTSFQGVMSSVGKITATLTDTSSIDQAGAKWQFTLIPNASVAPSTVTTTVIGATPNLSTTLSAGLLPRFRPGPNAVGYLDVEVIAPIVGDDYFNVTDNSIHTLTINGWKSSGGGSSITLKTNGTNNGSQAILNLQAGPGVTIVDNGTGTDTISAVNANTATDKYLGIAPYVAISGDWSVAINQAMTDLAANGLFGGNIHGNGVYNCNGTPLDPSGGNCILLAPVIPSVAGATVCTINFIGDVPTTPNANALSGMTFATTNNTAGVSLFGAYSATSWLGHVTAVKVHFNHVNFITTGPLCNALNGLWLNALELHDVLMVGAGGGSPIGGTGLITPSIANNFQIVIDRVGIFLYALGALIHEHAQMESFAVSDNYNGIQFDGQNSTGNSIGATNIWMQNNVNYLLGPSSNNLTKIQLSRVDFENDPGIGVNISDPNHALVGSIAYSKQSPLGPATTSGVTANLALFNLVIGGPPSSASIGFGLIENWYCQENQGTVFANSGYDFTNKLTGTNTTQATAAGFAGKVTTYNGTSSVSIAASATNTAFDGTLPFSGSATVNMTLPGSGDVIVMSNLDTSGSALPGFSFRVLAGGTLELYLISNIAGNDYIHVNASSASVTNGVPARICFTYDGSKTAAGIVFFVNGVALGATVVTDSLTGSIASSVPVHVGAETNGTGWLTGAIGLPGIWNRQLTIPDNP